MRSLAAVALALLASGCLGDQGCGGACPAPLAQGLAPEAALAAHDGLVLWQANGTWQGWDVARGTAAAPPPRAKVLAGPDGVAAVSPPVGDRGRSRVVVWHAGTGAWIDAPLGIVQGEVLGAAGDRVVWRNGDLLLSYPIPSGPLAQAPLPSGSFVGATAAGTWWREGDAGDAAALHPYDGSAAQAFPLPAGATGLRAGSGFVAYGTDAGVRAVGPGLDLDLGPAEAWRTDGGAVGLLQGGTVTVRGLANGTAATVELGGTPLQWALLADGVAACLPDGAVCDLQVLRVSA